MPDFARAAEGNKHINVLLDYDKETTPHLHNLNAGSHQHYETDKKFHNAEFFKINTEKLEHLFIAFEFPREGQRLWFLSHILFELLLDRVLIKLHPKKLDDFYNSLLSVDLEVVIEFLAQSNKEGRGRFSNFWNGFLEAKYLHYYVQNDSLIYSLNRVITRAKQPELTEAQTTVLLKIIEEMEGVLEGSVGDLKKELS